MEEKKEENQDVRRFIEAEMKRQPEARLFRCDYQGQSIWVKRAEHVYHKEWLQFSRWACMKLGLAMLQPGADTDGGKAIRFEAGRMRRLEKKGLPVPAVRAAGKDWLAVEDAGRNLAEILRDSAVSLEEKKRLVGLAAKGLAQFHALGLHHGRPAVKDMAWDGKQVRLLDFEDGIMMKVPRPRRVQRDVLLFLQSIIKEGEQAGVELAREALRTYAGEVPQQAQEAAKYFADFKGIYAFLKYFLRHTGADLETTYQTLRLFRETKNEKKNGRKRT